MRKLVVLELETGKEIELEKLENNGVVVLTVAHAGTRIGLSLSREDWRQFVVAATSL